MLQKSKNSETASAPCQKQTKTHVWNLICAQDCAYVFSCQIFAPISYCAVHDDQEPKAHNLFPVTWLSAITSIYCVNTEYSKRAQKV